VRASGTTGFRPPASLNHKRTPPTNVELVAGHTRRRYRVEEILEALPQEARQVEAPRAAPVRAADRHGDDRRLMEIPGAVYVAQLTGLTADRAHKVTCPFHEDDTPSLQLYPDGS
jgi:hypothetical protein